MKHSNGNGTSSRRSRSRNNRRGGGNQDRERVYDSNGPDVRIRGTAHQVAEKYLALAKDSASAGDHVMAESYYQFAEHYQRIIYNWDAEIQAYENALSSVGDLNRVGESISGPGKRSGSAQHNEMQQEKREYVDA
jgi:hypothetical protein